MKHSYGIASGRKLILHWPVATIIMNAKIYNRLYLKFLHIMTQFMLIKLQTQKTYYHHGEDILTKKNVVKIFAIFPIFPS